MPPPMEKKQPVCVFSRLPKSGKNKSLPPICIDLSRVANNVPMVPFPKFEKSAPLSPRIQIGNQELKLKLDEQYSLPSTSRIDHPVPAAADPPDTTRTAVKRPLEETPDDQVAALQLENMQLQNKVRILERKLGLMRERVALPTKPPSSSLPDQGLQQAMARPTSCRRAVFPRQPIRAAECSLVSES